MAIVTLLCAAATPDIISNASTGARSLPKIVFMMSSVLLLAAE